LIACGWTTGQAQKTYSSCQEALAKLFVCHPERSEGSQASENTRFFATLRMTIVVTGEFCQSLKSFSHCGQPDNQACPFLKRGNYEDLVLKSPFFKGGFGNLQTAGIYGKRDKRPGIDQSGLGEFIAE
jgi:hypothetical protein